MSGPVLAVDGGGSKTIALVAAADGRVLGAGRAGNADIYHNPEAELEVGRAIDDALASAGVRADELAGAALSLVGADWPEDFAHWRRTLPSLLPFGADDDRVQVVNDAIGALHSCSHAGAAVAIVCGTGAAIGARGSDGRCWHSSFWQRTQGAEEMVARGLDAVYLAALGIGPATALTRRALEHFGADDVEALLHRFTSRLRPRPEGTGRFAPSILDAAVGGDAVARELATSHADAVADYGLAAARQVGIGPGAAVRIVLAGGLFRHHSRLMADRVWARLRDVHRRASRIDGAPEPVVGALMLALRAADERPDEARRANVRATLPPSAYFGTDTPARAHHA